MLIYVFMYAHRIFTCQLYTRKKFKSHFLLSLNYQCSERKAICGNSSSVINSDYVGKVAHEKARQIRCCERILLQRYYSIKKGTHTKPKQKNYIIYVFQICEQRLQKYICKCVWVCACTCVWVCVGISAVTNFRSL